ncbi:carbohydrate sulfotransferase 11-like isoform X2 [Homarus americanus]|nr:carbohydrate sulfotransferase 11-like isoform X2 [Homarus americanus]
MSPHLNAYHIQPFLWGESWVLARQPQDDVLSLHRQSITSLGEVKGEDSTSSWEALQKERRAVVQEECGRISTNSSLFQVLQKDPTLKRLLIDDTHQAIYCFVPKVASTTWKVVWAELTGRVSISKKQHETFSWLHSLFNNDIRKENRQKSDLKHKVSSYTKFLVVRHPFERLLSAYRDKILVPDNKSFQKGVLSFVKRHRSNATINDIQWSDFVTYLIEGGYRLNIHWMPYPKLTYLCTIDYDFIAKYETLVQDSNEILRRIGAPESLHFPGSQSSNTKSLLDSYMKMLTKEQIKRLYTIYKTDFTFFQYTYNFE